MSSLNNKRCILCTHAQAESLKIYLVVSRRVPSFIIQADYLVGQYMFFCTSRICWIYWYLSRSSSSLWENQSTSETAAVNKRTSECIDGSCADTAMNLADALRCPADNDAPKSSHCQKKPGYCCGT